MFDLLFKGGFVVDGSGAPPVRADVGVRDGVIQEVGKLKGLRAARTIDAYDLMVSPGFIDIHAHDDYNLPVNPGGAGKVLQGVTTTVVGNCGWSPAPLLPEYRDDYVALSSFLDSGLAWNWQTFADYIAAVPPLALNFCQLVGHVAVRTAVMGVENRPPQGDELERMKALVAEAMEAGAVGFSTGLTYAPSCFAETSEVVELAKIAAQHGGIYATHMRGGGVFNAVQEAILIGKESGAPVQISHLKLATPATWGQTEALMALIDEARAEGQDVLCDQYPYLAGSSGLKNHMPRWVHEGGDDALLERLRDPEKRRRIGEEMESAFRSGEHVLSGWDKVGIAWSASYPELAGLRMDKAAETLERTAAEAYFLILMADKASTLSIDFVMDEPDVRHIMCHESTMIGSDGIFRGVDGAPDPGRPHPRHFGTFPRVLGHYVRKLGLLDLPTAIHKMTGLTASRLALKDRGLVVPGGIADLVLFNADTVADRSTYEDSQLPPTGIELVLNRGVTVAEAGRMVGDTPGGLLQREPVETA